MPGRENNASLEAQGHVTPDGGTLASGKGELTISLPAGAVAAAHTLVIRDRPHPGSFGSIGNDTLGLALGLLGAGQARRDREGNLLFENLQGPIAGALKGLNGTDQPVAMTIGHVILNTATFNENTGFGAEWLAHESAHARQSEMMGGVYLLEYASQFLQFGYRGHPMELEAREYARRYAQEYLKGNQEP